MKVKILYLLCLLLPCLGCFAAKPPKWVNQAMQTPTPQHCKDAPAYLLLDETVIEINTEGIATKTRRHSTRILNNQGLNCAKARFTYNGVADKINEQIAWLTQPKGKTEYRAGRDWIDYASSDMMTLSSENRLRQIDMSHSAVPEDVFSYETEVKGPLLVSFLEQVFAQTLPTHLQRLILKIPPGFRITHNQHGPSQATFSEDPANNLYSWTLHETAYKRPESYESRDANIDATVQIAITPPASCSSYNIPVFNSWIQLNTWVNKISAGRCDTSEALRQKVAALIANTPDDLGKIRAISSFVQQLRYLTDEVGLRSGLGFVPNAASKVLERGVGDCKDKVNLLRAMLGEAGIQSYAVLIHSNASRIIDDKMPNPMVFNHVICAIKVDPSIQNSATVEQEGLGRILYFDPTSYYTHLGDIPLGLQGNSAYVLDSAMEHTLRLPRIPAKLGHRIQNKATIHFDATAVPTLKVEMEAEGQIAAWLRAKCATHKNERDRKEFLKDLLSPRLQGVLLEDQSVSDQAQDGLVRIKLQTTGKNFLQPAVDNHYLMKLDIFGESYIPAFSELKRTKPIELPAYVQEDEISVTIPKGLEIEELPRNSSYTHEYGSFEVTLHRDGNTVTLHRKLSIDHQILPASAYPELRTFINGLSKSRRATLLLKRTTTALAQP